MRTLLAALCLIAFTHAVTAAVTPPPARSTSPDGVTYLDFWASWCAPCAQSFPWLNQMQQRYAAEGLRVVGVGVDTDDLKAQRFLKAHPAIFEIVRDPEGKLAEQYAIEGMPYGVILDADGKVVHRHSGFRADEAEAYEQAIKTALKANGERK